MSRKRLLIIDDEDDIREVASMTLEMTHGWELTTASSGDAGIELAANTRPDAIILDVMMPDKDGPATLRELQGLAGTADIPVIFLTAKVRDSDRERFMGLGVRGVLAKPFDPLTLGEQILDVLGWEAEGAA